MLLKKGFAYLREHGFRELMIKVYSKIREMKKKPQPYHKWIRLHLPCSKELRAQREERFAYPLLFSILIFGEEQTEELILSLKKQTYINYEVCWVSDGNVDQAIQTAKGDFLLFASAEDLLTPNALYEYAKVLDVYPETDMIYSDEDNYIKAGKHYSNPHFKSDYNVDLLCATNYIGDLLGVKKELAQLAGGWDQGIKYAEKYDFVMRCSEKAQKIVHIAKVLYHKYDEKKTASKDEKIMEAEKIVVKNHYERLGIPVSIGDGDADGVYRTKFMWNEKPLVSIIIPNKDHVDDLKRCIDSIEEKSTYRNYEFIIIENNSTEGNTFSFYKKLCANNKKIKVVYWDGPFNYSAINNFGVQYASGDYYLLLNNDTEIINDTCIEELLGYCMRKDVGAVGARLYFDDDTIQHAGVVIGFGGIAGHCFVQQPKGVCGYQNRIVTAQDYSAVTAACMMVRKNVFEEVGGLSEELAVAFNDIDFCMKIRQAGYLIVYNPYAELYHYESKSRGLEDTPEKVMRFNREVETFAKCWPEILKNGDPYYNPNLTLDSQDFSIKRI